MQSQNKHNQPKPSSGDFLAALLVALFLLNMGLFLMTAMQQTSAQTAGALSSGVRESK